MDQTQQSGSASDEKKADNLQSDYRTKAIRDLQLESRPEETGVLVSGSTSNSKELQLESAINVQSGSTLEETRDLQSDARSVLKPGFREDAQSTARPYVKPDSCSEDRKLLLISRSEETRDFQSGTRSGHLKPQLKLEEKNLQFGSEVTEEFQSGSRYNLKPGSRSQVSGCLKV